MCVRAASNVAGFIPEWLLREYPETASAASNGTTRTYYIAAEDTVWDYAPTGSNQMEGRPFQDVETRFMEAGPTVIGRMARKALYFEYTDDTFKTRKPRAPEWEHLGFLGPLVRAQVGDTIRIVFRNNSRFPASLHPHGVSYKKDSEGAHYNDGTSGADKAMTACPPAAPTFTRGPFPSARDRPSTRAAPRSGCTTHTSTRSATSRPD
jgi:hypothetical protein